MKKTALLHHTFHTILFLVAFIFCLNSISAQNDKNNFRRQESFYSKLFFGGGFGLQFGNLTLIELSPMVGYKVTPRFGVGVSPTYKYYKYSDSFNSALDFKTNVLGGSVFARYLITENIFAHTEYESLFFNTKLQGSDVSATQINSVFIGGGYRQLIGGNTSLNLMVLWNLNDTPDSPYTNPVIRMGLSVGM